MMKIGTGAIFVQLIPLPRRTPRENRSRPYFRFLSTCVACYLFLVAAAAAHACDIVVEVDKPANVSAAIYDSQGRMVRELARVIQILCENGVTILLVEQNMKLAEAVANELHIMVKGRMVYGASPEKFRAEEAEIRSRYLTV